MAMGNVFGYGSYMICDDGFRNVEQNGKPVGFQLQMRLANYRGFGKTNSPLAFGHGAAGGQIGWADPTTGISLGYCTNGFDRNDMRQGRRGVGISSLAVVCAG